MAEHQHGSMESKVQEQTFGGFIKAAMYVVYAVIAVLVFLAIFNS